MIKLRNTNMVTVIIKPHFIVKTKVVNWYGNYRYFGQGSAASITYEAKGRNLFPPFLYKGPGYG
jgi:hypothetical protein